jgi:hypothetical protein
VFGMGTGVTSPLSSLDFFVWFPQKRALRPFRVLELSAQNWITGVYEPFNRCLRIIFFLVKPSID